MVAAVSTMPNPKGPPRLPSESGNGVVVPRRPKSREVTSRYLSSPSSSSTTTSTSVTSSSYSSFSNSTPSRRHPSPLVSRTAPLTPLPVSSMAVKRSPLAERRRPSTPGNVGEMSATAKLLVTSRRSLSVSFQGESFSLPISRTKPAPTPAPNHLSSARKGTPERRRVAENSKLIDQRRWPGRLREVNSLTRSLDFTAEKEKLGGSGSLVSALQQSMIEDSNKASSNCRLKAHPVNDANSTARSTAASDPAASDTKSVSSGNNGRVQECGSVAQEGGIAAPLRFWQENTISKDNNLNTVGPAKLNVRNKSFIENSISSPRGVSSSRGLSSLVRGAFRPSSPSKLVTSSDFSPSRGMSSPSRVRNGVASMLNNYLSNTPSILSFAAEVRGRGKVGENQIVDAHNLRLLYNRYLQWRFINSRADAAMLVQKITGEKSLYIAWVTTSKLRRSIKSKGVELQLLRQSLRLYTILKGQMLYLNNWELIDEDNSGSLSEAIEALESNTLRLPIVGGARADIQNVKDAICSAVDVMQAMASSICSLLTKVDEVNSLVSELANVTSKERALLDQCKDLLSTLTAMQVKDCSMRTQILQLSRKP